MNFILIILSNHLHQILSGPPGALCSDSSQLVGGLVRLPPDVPDSLAVRDVICQAVDVEELAAEVAGSVDLSALYAQVRVKGKFRTKP